MPLTPAVPSATGSDGRHSKHHACCSDTREAWRATESCINFVCQIREETETAGSGGLWRASSGAGGRANGRARAVGARSKRP